MWTAIKIIPTDTEDKNKKNKKKYIRKIRLVVCAYAEYYYECVSRRPDVCDVVVPVSRMTFSNRTPRSSNGNNTRRPRFRLVVATIAGLFFFFVSPPSSPPVTISIHSCVYRTNNIQGDFVFFLCLFLAVTIQRFSSDMLR